MRLYRNRTTDELRRPLGLLTSGETTACDELLLSPVSMDHGPANGLQVCSGRQHRKSMSQLAAAFDTVRQYNEDVLSSSQA